MNKMKNIALVAHDNRKRDLIEWVQWNFKVLLGHNLICTGTTALKMEEPLRKKLPTRKHPSHSKGLRASNRVR